MQIDNEFFLCEYDRTNFECFHLPEDGVSCVLKINASKYMYSISGLVLLITKSSKRDLTA